MITNSNKIKELIKIKVVEFDRDLLLDFFTGCESRLHFFKMYFNDSMKDIYDKLPIHSIDMKA